MPVYEVNEDTELVPLAPIAEVFVESKSQMVLQEAVNQKGFTPLEVDRIQSFKESDTYWYRFALKNTENKSLDLVLKTLNKNVVNAHFYQLDAKFLKNETMKEPEIESVVYDFEAFGDYRLFVDRPIRSRQYALTFRIPPYAEHHFYLRWQDKGQAVFEMELVDVPSFFSEQMSKQGYFFLIIGFAIGVLIYNLSIFWRIGEQLYLSYALYISSFIAFLETENGSIAVFWPSFLSYDLRASFMWTMAFMVMFTAARFTSQMLLLKEREPERASLFSIVQVFALLFLLASFVAPYQVVEYAAYIASVTLVSICIVTAFQIYRRYGDNSARIYLLSFLPVALSVVLVAATYALELFAFPYMSELLRIVFCLNLVILSLALANQIQVMNEKQRNYEGMLMAAKASELAKSEFFGKMSHEIRTPLNGVIGMSQLLDDGELNEKQKGYVEVLSASSRSLMHLVNNIVDFSQVDAGRMQLSEAPFDVLEMLLDIEKVMMIRTLESRIPLIFDLKPGMPRFVYGDVDRIRQVLINLLGNAYKFTSEGLIKIKIFTLKNDGRWSDKHAFRIEVSDTGIGIPSGQVESIFEDFTQVYSSNARKYGGAGLGLAICREISRLLGGEIKLHSQLGRGSTFILEIPLRQADAQELAKLKPKVFPVREFVEIERDPLLASRSLLLIDCCDEPRALLENTASEWGMKVGAVSNLEDGLSSARRSSDVSVGIDLVMVDYECLEHQEGGNHFIKALARHEATRSAIVIVLVSQTQLNISPETLSGDRVFLLQRKALVTSYYDAFVAVTQGDLEYFKHNQPLFLEYSDQQERVEGFDF